MLYVLNRNITFFFVNKVQYSTVAERRASTHLSTFFLESLDFFASAIFSTRDFSLGLDASSSSSSSPKRSSSSSSSLIAAAAGADAGAAFQKGGKRRRKKGRIK